MTKIAIVGSGNVGSALGNAFVQRGQPSVLFYDVRADQLDKLHDVIKGEFQTTTDFNKLLDRDVVFLCVPTEALKPTGDADLTIITGVVKHLAGRKFGGLVVQMSTCPPLTARKLSAIYPNYAVLPSYYTMGRMFYDALNPVRILIGTSDGKPNGMLVELFSNFGGPMFFDTYEAVELTKYVENVLSATLISFWNEVYLVVKAINEKCGLKIDSDKVAKIVDVADCWRSVYRFHGKGFSGVCLKGSTRVITDKGFRPISDIQAGDWVLSHDGYYHIVTGTFERDYDGYMNLIGSQGFRSTPTITTPEHPIWCSQRVSTRERLYTTNVEGRGTIQKMANLEGVLSPEFIIPSMIQQGDFMILPRFNELSSEVPSAEMQAEHKHDYKLKLTPELMYLFGLYLAEGSIYKGCISFSFHAKEGHFLEEIDNIMRTTFGCSASKHKSKSKGNSLVVRTTCMALSKYLIRTFGIRAENKKIPWEWLKLPPSLIIPLVRGIWYGDGSNCVGSNGYRRFTFGTVSRNLSDFMELAFLKLKVPFRVHISPSHVGRDGVAHLESYYIYGIDNEIMNKLLPKLRVPLVGQQHKTSWFENGNFIYPVKETGIVKFTGKVYNLEVDGSDSYVVEGATLHNCLPKDLKAYIEWCNNNLGYEPNIAKAVQFVNEYMRETRGVNEKHLIYRQAD